MSQAGPSSASQDEPSSQDFKQAWTQEQESRRKPGQKFPQPTPGAADRVFYESLLGQRPDSQMAKVWCLEHGCVSKERALELVAELGTSAKRGSASPARPAKKHHSSSSSSHYRRDEGEIDVGMDVGSITNA
jgi:hypothetical protein